MVINHIVSSHKSQYQRNYHKGCYVMPLYCRGISLYWCLWKQLGKCESVVKKKASVWILCLKQNPVSNKGQSLCILASFLSKNGNSREGTFHWFSECILCLVINQIILHWVHQNNIWSRATITLAVRTWNVNSSGR